MNKPSIYHEHSPQLDTLWKKSVARIWSPDGETGWYDQSLREVMVLGTLLRKFRIEPQGVLYLGAHSGYLLWVWLLLGYRNVLMVEPQEDVFKRLATVAKATSAMAMVRDQMLDCEEPTQIHVAQCAISDHDGEADFFVMAHSMLSSLQAPNVTEFGQQRLREAMSVNERVTVPVRTLDSLLRELAEGGSDTRYNTLYLNIQGAELKALQGARQTLKHIEFIHLEVNIKERYVGAPTAEDIDTFLGELGFEPGWGMRYPTIGNGHTAYVRKR
ncbi:FkbM family methyltransferase [Corallococcus macrosporus]|uniref:FkbM family methyltransferase n=1 Tax=Corallococcus macrosporus TaxID=35 RepID=A0ABS3DPW4_9BACT|nr:FkbM family methyltransferase [Corallococcus macrosporus]MBN8233381.1 FkbM family methyltransferase [Corallococcus macrosporus]